MDNNNTLSTYVNNVTLVSSINNNKYSSAQDQRGFWNILKFTIIIIGTLANITLLVLLVKEKQKKTSYTVYVGSIVVNDIIFFIGEFLETILNQMFDYDIHSENTFSCKFYYPVQESARLLRGWLVFGLTIERLILAYFPRMTKLLDRGMTGLISVVLIVCVILFINVHYVMHSELVLLLRDGTVISECLVVNLYYGDQYVLYYDLHIKFVIPIIAAVLPAACLLIGTILLMKAFCQSLRAPATTPIISGHDRGTYVFTTMMSVIFFCIDMPTIALKYFTFRDGTAFIFVIEILFFLTHSLKCLVYVLCKRSVRMCCIGGKVKR